MIEYVEEIPKSHVVVAASLEHQARIMAGQNAARTDEPHHGDSQLGYFPTVIEAGDLGLGKRKVERRAQPKRLAARIVIGTDQSRSRLPRIAGKAPARTL